MTYLGLPSQKAAELLEKFKKGVAPLVLIIVIGIVLAAGGLGLGLAWRAGLIGKPGGPEDGTTTNGTQPTPPPSDGTENGEVPPPPQSSPSDGEEPQPTIEGWKVYANNKYRIEYPGDWHVFDYSFYRSLGSPLYPPSNPPDGSLEILLTEMDHFPAYDEDDRIGRLLIGLRDDMTAEELAHSRTLSTHGGESGCTVESAVIDGQEGFKVVCIQEISWYFQDKTSPQTFQIESSYPDSAKETSPALLEKIFSTFRFMD